MELRLSKGFIRFILILISFQFFSLAISPGYGAALLSNKTYLNAEHSQSFALSVFFEESKTEKEGEGENEKDRLLHCFEIADLSYISQLLVNKYSPLIAASPIEQQYDLKPPLFKLHHTFII
jgi:hypothetical protein